MGIKEQLIFPEIEYDKIDKVRGMDICFVTTAQTDEEGRELLSLMGAPYFVNGAPRNSEIIYRLLLQHLVILYLLRTQEKLRHL